MFKDISDFFNGIWDVYINFMTKVFGYGLSIGITVAIGFLILCVVALKMINKK